MQHEPEFRVLSKSQAAALLVASVALCSLGLWFALDWLEAYQTRIAALDALPVDDAIAAVTFHVRVLAIAQALVLAAFCGFMLWYCRRAIQTQSMPPAGAWIIAGQRVRTGPDAIRAARLLLALTAAIAVLGAFEMAYLFYVVEALRDAAADAPPA